MLHRHNRHPAIALRAGPRCRLLIAAALALFTALSGCSTAATTKPEAAAISLSPAHARTLPVYRGKVGSLVSWNEILALAAAADVVILGENHGHSIGLPWAATFFDDLLKEAPAAALALEFFERDEQTRVDDYLLGLTDEKAFTQRTGRTNAASGNYPPGHRQMVESAKANNRPVIAANAPRTIIRYLRGKNYDDLSNLTSAQRQLFRIPEATPQGRYRDDFDAIMTAMSTESHGTPAATATVADAPTIVPEPNPLKLTPQQSEKFDAKFRGQQLWDWTMAESVTRAVELGNHPVVLVVGRFHSDFFGGTPQAIATLRPGTKILIISIVDRSSASLDDDDRDRADFVVYVGPSADDDAESK